MLNNPPTTTASKPTNAYNYCLSLLRVGRNAHPKLKFPLLFFAQGKQRRKRD